jgi:hypothetical protein
MSYGSPAYGPGNYSAASAAKVLTTAMFCKQIVRQVVSLPASPKLLLSGIGSADDLAGVGIEVRVDLPGIATVIMPISLQNACLGAAAWRSEPCCFGKGSAEAR